MGGSQGGKDLGNECKVYCIRIMIVLKLKR